MESKLYTPTIVKKEVNDSHYYYVDGTYVPGVTTIIGQAIPKPFLREWQGQVGNTEAKRILEAAGDRGSKIHNACERLAHGDSVNLYTEFPADTDKKCIVSFLNWANEYNPVFKKEHIEFVVTSKRGYAGTLDLFCHINGVPTIVDYKTSKSIHIDHFIQITAYQQALFEMTGIMANRMILHLNPKTKKGYRAYTDKDMHIKKNPVTILDFETVFSLYKMLNGGVSPEPKLRDVYPETVKLIEHDKGGEKQNE